MDSRYTADDIKGLVVRLHRIEKVLSAALFGAERTSFEHWLENQGLKFDEVYENFCSELEGILEELDIDTEDFHTAFTEFQKLNPKEFIEYFTSYEELMDFFTEQLADKHGENWLKKMNAAYFDHLKPSVLANGKAADYNPNDRAKYEAKVNPILEQANQKEFAMPTTQPQSTNGKVTLMLKGLPPIETDVDTYTAAMTGNGVVPTDRGIIFWEVVKKMTVKSIGNFKFADDTPAVQQANINGTLQKP